MLQRFASYIWLLMLTMVVPTQAFGYLLQAENEASARLNYRIGGVLPQSAGDFQALFDEVRQDKPSEPVTKSDLSQDWLGIITANRWTTVSRTFDENGGGSTSEPTSFEPESTPLYRLYKLPIFTSVYHNAERDSSYRISGWKESNTLYVALNGHFS